MEKKKIDIIVEHGNDGIYTAIPQHEYKIGFFGSGETVEEALEDLKNSHAEAKEMLSDLPDFEYNILYDVASFLQLFGQKLSLSGLQVITGINRKQLSHYVTGHSKPSPVTVRKIELGIKKFREDLNRVVFI